VLSVFLLLSDIHQEVSLDPDGLFLSRCCAIVIITIVLPAIQREEPNGVIIWYGTSFGRQRSPFSFRVIQQEGKRTVVAESSTRDFF